MEPKDIWPNGYEYAYRERLRIGVTFKYSAYCYAANTVAKTSTYYLNQNDK